MTKRGWKFLEGSPKAHYFIEQRSLCGRFLAFTDGGLEDDNHKSPDNCVSCMKKHEKLTAKEGLICK